MIVISTFQLGQKSLDTTTVCLSSSQPRPEASWKFLIRFNLTLSLRTSSYQFMSSWSNQMKRKKNQEKNVPERSGFWLGQGQVGDWMTHSSHSKLSSRPVVGICCPQCWFPWFHLAKYWANFSFELQSTWLEFWVSCFRTWYVPYLTEDCFKKKLERWMEEVIRREWCWSNDFSIIRQQSRRTGQEKLSGPESVVWVGPRCIIWYNAPDLRE